MKIKINLVFFLISIICFYVIILQRSSVYASQEFFPFLGEISSDKVNVRAGQSKNFEKLCVLNKNDNIIAIDKSYSWYKVKLPVFAKNYISADYVEMLDNIKGRVKGNKVNVRARPSLTSSIIGKVKKGDIIYISSFIDGWYAIEPVAGIYGWISSRFIKFVSSDISKYKTKYVSLKEKEDAKILIQKQKYAKKIKKALENKEKIKKARIITVIGLLDAEHSRDTTETMYKIVVDGKPSYFLEGFEYLIDRFLSYNVKIRGEIDKNMISKYSLPVINISKIQLVL